MGTNGLRGCTIRDRLTASKGEPAISFLVSETAFGKESPMECEKLTAAFSIGPDPAKILGSLSPACDVISGWHENLCFPSNRSRASQILFCKSCKNSFATLITEEDSLLIEIKPFGRRLLGFPVPCIRNQYAQIRREHFYDYGGLTNFITEKGRNESRISRNQDLLNHYNETLVEEIRYAPSIGFCQLVRLIFLDKLEGDGSAFGLSARSKRLTF